MSTAVCVSMQEAAVSISDWLLSFLAARNNELYDEMYSKMFTALEKKKVLDVEVFKLLLEHHEQVFNILVDVKAEGTIKIKMPLHSHDGRNDWSEKVKKCIEVFREAEEFYVVLLEMAMYFDNQDEQKSNLSHILFEITRNGGELAEFRLKLIMFAYNMLPVGSKFRWATFKQFLSYATKNKLFHLALPYLAVIDEWQKDWNFTLKQKRVLYSSIRKDLQTAASESPAVAAKVAQAEMFVQFMRLYVDACNGEGLEVLNDPETIEAAEQLIFTSLKDGDPTKLDQILCLDAVRNLKQTEHAAKLVELLEIFVHGSPQDLAAFRERHPEMFSEETGLNYDVCLSKCMLLTLTSLASHSSLSASTPTSTAGVLKISELAVQLGLNEAATERLLVQAIGQKLLDAKIDQINQTVAVTSAIQREFGLAQWQLLHQRLSGWNRNTRQVVAALKNTKEDAAISKRR